jgi:cytochrome c oxidase subunit 2
VRRGAIVRISLLTVVAAAIAALVAILIPWLPDPASEEMERIEFAYWFATVISIGIFAVVMAVLLYSVFAFRAPPEDESDGPSIHGNTNLEIVWTLVPAVLVIAIGILSAVVLSQNGDAGNNPLTIKVYAQQFSWRFEYPDQDGLRSDELVMPLDRAVELEMTAADVIHSFWIPAMGQKQDLVPGVETSIVVTPTRIGSFPLVCTELCGLGHATMRAPVRVVTETDFAAWVKGKQGGDGTDGDDPGKAVFASAGCGGCHAFTPAGTAGAVGPGLDDVAAAAEAAGEDVATYVKEAIVDPDKVVAGGYQPGVMPGSYGESLSAEEIDALVTYLTAGSQ